MGRIDETGNEYGLLKVLHYDETRKTPNGTNKTIWVCQCKCGRKIKVSGGDLRRKKGTKGCRTCSLTKHGHCPGTGRSREYSCYRSMLSRCKADKRYKKKGITVCHRWKGADGFTNFLTDMGPCPSPDHSVDRRDNAKGYYPENCRWATMAEQNRNKDTNVKITLDGREETIGDWLKIMKVDAWSYYNRLRKGMTPEQALKMPSQVHAPKTEEHRRKLSEANQLLTEKDKEKARKLRADGWSFPKIGKELGIHSSTAARACGKNY